MKTLQKLILPLLLLCQLLLGQSAFAGSLKPIDFIKDLNTGDKPLQVDIRIQNSNPDLPGACFGCGGSDGYGGSIGDFAKNNPNLTINIQHGAKD